jgi:hypothetical protein
LKMGESTTLETLKKFIKTIIDVAGNEYLRPPTEQEVQHILEVKAAQSFSSMLGSIDCIY